MSCRHIAIIMDGNGRWANKRGQKRSEGHKKGAEVVREITEFCAKDADITHLTLYAFSTENWKRSRVEVEFLFNLMERYLKNELATYRKNGIRFNTIGESSQLPKKLQERIEQTVTETRTNQNLTHTLAVNYGGQDEIVRAAKSLCETGAAITQESLAHALDTAQMPPVDMLIRTGGEKRISNFLLWQSAYAELFFTDTLFPDFNSCELQRMIEEFGARERRFGAA